ncbi:PREDICTED: ras-related protein Rab-3C-like isoform X2 [Acropora digitifera]|uniref:ras-related protein Rab-3C-like isoform X2 n=1 Tax=Acropora digitifera TaxID=70779 RepID=UPI00077A97B9|nr:PREDICTED: ras-related protein Rab-3C-like isoform X2 [Acropora digitifera]
MASADQTLDESLKILVIGDSDVGKTSLVFRFVDGSFSSQFVPTVGIDFKSKTIVWNDKRIQLQIWDTAGQERYRSITTSYFRGAAGFVIMYDIRNEVSFNGVQEWVSQIKTYSGPEAKKILVGNMTDEEKEREVTIKKGSILKAKTPPTKPETTKLFDKSVSTAKDSWCYC